MMTGAEYHLAHTMYTLEVFTRLKEGRGHPYVPVRYRLLMEHLRDPANRREFLAAIDMWKEEKP